MAKSRTEVAEENAAGVVGGVVQKARWVVVGMGRCWCRCARADWCGCGLCRAAGPEYEAQQQQQNGTAAARVLEPRPRRASVALRRRAAVAHAVAILDIDAMVLIPIPMIRIPTKRERILPKEEEEEGGGKYRKAMSLIGWCVGLVVGWNAVSCKRILRSIRLAFAITGILRWKIRMASKQEAVDFLLK